MHNYSNLILNSKHQQLHKIQAFNMALINNKAFLPNPSLGSTQVYRTHHWPPSSPAAPHGFLFPALFNHSAANPKMILNWLKSTKPPKRVCISPGAPRAPETFSLSLAGSFLCSPVPIKQDLLCPRISTMKGFKGDIIHSSLLGQGILQLSLLDLQSNSYSSSKLCQEKDCSSVNLLSFADSRANRKYKHAYIKAPDV